MTDKIMVLRGLMEKSTDADLRREMIGLGTQRRAAGDGNGDPGDRPGSGQDCRRAEACAVAGVESRPATGSGVCLAGPGVLVARGSQFLRLIAPSWP